MNSTGKLFTLFHHLRAVLNIFRSTFLNRFEPDDRNLQQVPVRVTSDKGPPGVKFYSSTKHDKDRQLLGRLYFTSLSPLKKDFEVRLIYKSYSAFLFPRSSSLRGFTRRHSMDSCGLLS